MKVFAVSLLLLFVMLFCIGANYIYINEVSVRLERSLDALPALGEEGCQDAARRLLEDWEKESAKVSLSISYTVVDRVGEQASLLVSSAERGDVDGFYTARTLLYDAIKDLRRAEAVFVSLFSGS